MRARRFLAVLLALTACAASAQENRFSSAARAYLVVRDGEQLWAGNERERLPPASLAKMMTALLALERGRPDEQVRLGRAVLAATGTRIGLKPGETLAARDLLAATVVRSANDACRALAAHLGKGVAAFVERMNARARELGMADTRFADPCGHDRPGQHTTAADLALLADEVMRHGEYLRLARTERMSIATAEGRRIGLRNTNALLGRYPDAIGLKTGYTEAAGNCLVALAERDGVRVLVVMLNSPNRWWNAVGLLNRAFDEPRR